MELTKHKEYIAFEYPLWVNSEVNIIGYFPANVAIVDDNSIPNISNKMFSNFIQNIPLLDINNTVIVCEGVGFLSEDFAIYFNDGSATLGSYNQVFLTK